MLRDVDRDGFITLLSVLDCEDVVGLDGGADGGRPTFGVVLVFERNGVIELYGAVAMMLDLIDEDVGVELAEVNEPGGVEGIVEVGLVGEIAFEEAFAESGARVVF